MTTSVEHTRLTWQPAPTRVWNNYDAFCIPATKTQMSEKVSILKQGFADRDADLVSNRKHGYPAAEIEVIGRTFNKTGRPIVFSPSPGPGHSIGTTTLVSTPSCGGSLRISATGRIFCKRCLTSASFAQTSPHGELERSRFTSQETRSMLNLGSDIRSPLPPCGHPPELSDGENAMWREPLPLGD